MAKQKALSGQGGQTAIVSVRVTPKLRYLTELAARKQRRSVSNFIEWAVAESLQDVVLGGLPGNLRNAFRGGEAENLQDIVFGGLPESGHGDATVADQSTYLWEVHEADRFIKLACDYPELLTHEEHILWCIVRSNKFLWRKYEGSDEISVRTNYMPPDRYFIYERLREHWDKFKAVAMGEAELSTLVGLFEADPEP